MAMSRARTDVAVAVLAKAPIPGFAKTRLIPALGAEGAAALQARLIERAVETAAAIGPVTLWVTPDEKHPLFRKLSERTTLARQPEGDLGARMLAAVAATRGPVLVTGTDCPALTPDHLRAAAGALRDGIDVVVIPVEDGGYAMIGMKEPHAGIFTGMTWSAPTVMAETRRRLVRLGLSWREPARLWDLDRPEDLDRLKATGLAAILSSP
jgi:rSAM/selenodomain-associated transferase 1